MDEIHLLEVSATATLLSPPEEVTSHVHDVSRETSSATPVPVSEPSWDGYSSTAAPVSPTQVVGTLLEFDGKEEVLLPCKMISRPAATRIYHLDKSHMIDVPHTDSMIH